MIKSSQSPHFQRLCVPKDCCGKNGPMQPYRSPNPIQSRALVYCVAPQADCLSHVHHHHGRNRGNNPRARHLCSGSGQTAQTPISDSGSGQAGSASYHCLNFQVLTCGRPWNPSSRPGAGLEAGLAAQQGREGAHTPPRSAAWQAAPVERGTCTEELWRRKPGRDIFLKEGVELIFDI